MVETFMVNGLPTIRATAARRGNNIDSDNYVW